jgi:hypothetical protein
MGVVMSGVVGLPDENFVAEGAVVGWNIRRGLELKSLPQYAPCFPNASLPRMSP